MSAGDGLLYFANKYNIPKDELIMKIAERYSREIGPEKYNELLEEVRDHGRERCAEIAAS